MNASFGYLCIGLVIGIAVALLFAAASVQFYLAIKSQEETKKREVALRETLDMNSESVDALERSVKDGLAKMDSDLMQVSVRNLDLTVKRFQQTLASFSKLVYSQENKIAEIDPEDLAILENYGLAQPPPSPFVSSGAARAMMRSAENASLESKPMPDIHEEGVF